MNWEIKAFDQLSLQELYSILTLRTDVFVVEQACPYPEVDGKDPNCLHLLGTDEGELVAYLRILPAGLSYDEVSIGRVVIKPSHRGKGLGRPMMEQAIAYITTEWKESQIKIGAKPIWKNSISPLALNLFLKYIWRMISHIWICYTVNQSVRAGFSIFLGNFPQKLAILW